MNTINNNNETRTSIESSVNPITEQSENPVPLTFEEMRKKVAFDNYWKRVIEMSISITEMYYDFKTNRELFIMMLVKQSCRFGVPESSLKSRMNEVYQVEENEMDRWIKMYYNEESFGRDWFLLANVFRSKPTLQTAPEFPREIYKALPAILQKSVEVLAEGRQRDMFLLSALTVLSGCIHNFTGLYDGKVVYPNIYSFIVAPAANGKGVIQFAKKLGQKYHKALLDEWKEAGENFKNQNEEDEDSEIEEPVRRLLYLPANSSAAAFVEKLKASQGRAVMFETEADTIASTLKNDWGGYSELMRSAFHHETISVNRKGKDGLVEIDNPRLSISISGTPAQVGTLHKSQENGLFSRFTFYAFSDAVQWKSVAPGLGVANKDDYFEALSEQVLNLVKYCETYPTKFDYTGQQWDELNERFRILMDYFVLAGNNSELLGVLIRQGLIRFRISMILSALRRFDEQDKGEVYYCSDGDFELAEKIADVLLAHSFIAMDLIPKSADPSMGNSEQKFFNALPKKFDRLEAVQVGEGINLKPRSCDGYLKRLVDKGKLEKVANGVYLKI